MSIAELSRPVFPIAIDNSMRKELVKCEMAAHYKYERGLRSADETRVDLHAGKAFAKGMEAARLNFYSGGVNAQDAVNEGIRAVYAKYGSFIAPPKSNKTADRMAGALAYYFDQCPLDAETLVPLRLNGKLAIEVSFDLPLGILHPDTGAELRYAGRFDMLAQDQTGDVWVVDEKTTSQMGEKWANQWFLDSQMTGYCWGARKLLEQHGLEHLEVKGAIVNGIAIRLRDYEHARLNVYRQDWEVQRWLGQMMVDIQNWKQAYLEQRHNQVLDHACANYNNPCEYSSLCKSRNPERIIESGSYIVERWNPLERKD